MQLESAPESTRYCGCAEVAAGLLIGLLAALLPQFSAGKPLLHTLLVAVGLGALGAIVGKTIGLARGARANRRFVRRRT